MRLPAAIGLVCALAAPARAYDFDIYAQTVGQGYQLRAADDTLINRRRIDQSLGLEIYNLGPHDVMGRPLDRNQFYLSVMMRFESDLGDYPNYKELSGRSAEHSFDPARLDLMWAYLGAHNLFGFLDFKLGRQVFLDAWDYRALDGLDLDFKTPFHLGLEVWGGLNVSGEAPIDSPIYRADGVALNGNPLGSLGQRQESELQPTFGFALHTIGLRDLQARVSYLRTMSFTGDARQPGEPDSGVVEEKLSATVRARLFGGLLHPWVGVRYDVLNGRVDQIHAGARLQLDGARHGITAEYVYDVPTFDGDSIWNVFASEAFNDARLTYDVRIGPVRAYARGFARIFQEDKTTTNGTVAPSNLGSGVAGGGSLGAQLDAKRGYIRLDSYYEDGYGGLKAGVDVGAKLALWGDLYTGLVAEGRLSYVHFRDDSRTIDHADSFGLQAGLRYSFTRGLNLHVVIEENVNRIYDSQFRLLALLDISFWLGKGGGGYALQRPGLF
ncbi:MAG TPA: hypothetical protein VH328_16065 [Burkholderiaceae bacterium]|nr:hypothetical protein [Burkholderiaceae bacterium]